MMLAEAAVEIVVACDPAQKVRLAREAACAWRQRRLSTGRRIDAGSLPERPGRPDRPALLPPRNMPRRGRGSAAGRIALLHALAHIELNAIDLSWDLIARFTGETLPRAFYDDWVRVGAEEAEHFALVEQRLRDLGASYGDLPAHDGLWQAAQDTGHSLLARLAIIPLVLEARGLDVTPPMIERAQQAGDAQTANILETVYREEKGHVAIGYRWFRYLCERQSLAPEATFHTLVRTHFRGTLKPPFNDKARSAAGLTPGFYRPLVGLSPHSRS